MIDGFESDLFGNAAGWALIGGVVWGVYGWRSSANLTLGAFSGLQMFGLIVGASAIIGLVAAWLSVVPSIGDGMSYPLIAGGISATAYAGWRLWDLRRRSAR